jgi:hypothetical protein
MPVRKRIHPLFAGGQLSGKTTTDSADDADPCGINFLDGGDVDRLRNLESDVLFLPA